MRLVLIFFILFSCCLWAGFGKQQTGLLTEMPQEKQETGMQVSSKLSDHFGEQNWMRDYCLMIKVLSPVKQLDLPGDNSKSWNFLLGKTLRSEQKAETQGRCYPLLFTQYIRFLSGRYVNGFYIYSLRELII